MKIQINQIPLDSGICKDVGGLLWPGQIQEFFIYGEIDKKRPSQRPKFKRSRIKMRIPVIPATHSGRSRPPVPAEVGRLFRRKPATDSGAKRPPIGAKRRWC